MEGAYFFYNPPANKLLIPASTGRLSYFWRNHYSLVLCYLFSLT